MSTIKYGGGPNPPVRLDKWQNIVGVGWGGGEITYLAARFSCFALFTASWPDQRDAIDGATPVSGWISENYVSAIRFDGGTGWMGQEWQAFLQTGDIPDNPSDNPSDAPERMEGRWTRIGLLNSTQANAPSLPAPVSVEPFLYGARYPGTNFFLDEGSVEVSYNDKAESHLVIIGIRTEYAPEDPDASAFPLLTPSGQAWVSGTSVPIACKGIFEFFGERPAKYRSGTGIDTVAVFGGRGAFIDGGDNPQFVGTTIFDRVHNVDFEGPDLGTPSFDLSGLEATYQGRTFKAVGFRRQSILAVEILYAREEEESA
jgi:hypothetical protein